MSLAGYVWWFAKFENYRVNPDMAGLPTPRLWSDTLAGLLLAGGLSQYLTYRSAARRVDVTAANCNVRTGGLFAVLAAMFIAVSQTWYLCKYFDVFGELARGFRVAGWQSLAETAAELMIMPETMIPVLVLISAWTLVWRVRIGGSSPKPLPPMPPRTFAGHAVAWLALVVVGAPTIAIFGFCWWLGPFMLR